MVPGAAFLAPHPTAGCCHLANLMPVYPEIFNIDVPVMLLTKTWLQTKLQIGDGKQYLAGCRRGGLDSTSRYGPVETAETARLGTPLMRPLRLHVLGTPLSRPLRLHVSVRP